MILSFSFATDKNYYSFKLITMKKIMLVLLFATATIFASAQVQFGLKAGVNFSTLGGDDFDEVTGKKSNTGFYFGGLAHIPISDNFGFQPELIYSAKQGLEFVESGDELNLNLNYLNIPLMLQYKTSGFYLEAGPQIGLLLTAKSKITIGGVTAEEDIKDELKGVDFGINLGLGYVMSSGFGFGARYNFGMSNIVDDPDADAKNRVFSFGLIYRFGGKAKSDK